MVPARTHFWVACDASDGRIVGCVGVKMVRLDMRAMWRCVFNACGVHATGAHAAHREEGRCSGCTGTRGALLAALCKHTLCVNIQYPLCKHTLTPSRVKRRSGG